MAGALLTDLYELTMAASYLRHDMVADATFSLFVRALPTQRGFLVAAGAQECCGFLEQFSFEEDDLAYLSSIGFADDTLAAFANLRFTGDVFAIPTGRIVLANEPLLEVTAPIAEAQLVETWLLNQISLQTLLATKAARGRVAARGKIDLVEFGFRRAQGLEAGLAAARLTAMVGFSATSNVDAARRYGLVATGTMAHSYVEAFEHETDAFSTFAEDFPDRVTFLVDTYDTASGVARAIEVIRARHLEGVAAVRLDSGDLVELSVKARHLLDRAGLSKVRIFVSGGLDENDVARFLACGAPIDAVGLGTRVDTSADAPYLDSAYKLVAYDGRPVVKLSQEKATLPGPKQVFRGSQFHDVIGCRDEEPPPGTVPLLTPVMRSGRRVGPTETLEDARARFEADLAALPAEATDLLNPLAPAAAVSPALEALTEQVREAARRTAGLPHRDDTDA